MRLVQLSVVRASWRFHVDLRRAIRLTSGGMNLPKIQSDGRVIFALPPTKAPGRESVIYFTLPKSGSVMLTQFMAQLCPEVGLTRVYIEGKFFELGIRGDFFQSSKRQNVAPASTSAIYLDKGYCYGSPILPLAYDIPILGKVKAILLVRDPRDMLVSLYYSFGESHPTPGKASEVIRETRELARRVGIDEYVIHEAPRYARMLRQYHEKVVSSPLTKVFRYEDVVYDKAKWISEICAHFGWDVPLETQEAFAKSADVFPAQEKPEEHIRQVHPGNYKKKLHPTTITQLDEVLSDAMAPFGYAPD